MADGIPPWLNIDPLRPVQFFLQGTSTGVGAAEARNRAQAAAMELAQRAAAQQAANERAALAAQSDAAQTAARIQDLQQQRELNEQKAAVMAKVYAASNSMRDAIARGVPPAQAAYMFPDFYLQSPAAFAQSVREQQVTPSMLEREIDFYRRVNPNATQQDIIDMTRERLMGHNRRFAADPMANALEEARQADIKGDKEASALWRERAGTLARGGPLPAAEALRRFDENRKQQEAAGAKKTSSGFSSWLKGLFSSTEKAEETPAPKAGTNLAPFRQNIPLEPTPTRAPISNATGEVNRVRVIRPDGTRGWIIGSPADIDAALQSGTYVLDSPGASGGF